MNPFSRFRRTPVDALPRIAAYSDPAVAAVVDAARPGRPVLGLGHHSHPVVAPSSGHLLVVSGAGGGRSTFMRAIGAQALRDGHRVVVLDHKGRSQSWAKFPLPGCQVAYETLIDDIADQLVTIRQEALANYARTDGHNPPGITVLFDDPISTLGRLTERWRSAGNTGRGDAVDAYRDLLYMGRAEGVRLVVGTSSVTTRTFGPEMREFFTRVVSARVSRNTWACATGGGVDHPGHPDSTPGRFYLADGDVTPFRGLLMTNAEAGDVATSTREQAH